MFRINYCLSFFGERLRHPVAARALLTRFCCERALEACAEADRLAKTLAEE